MSTIKSFNGRLTVIGKQLQSEYDRDILSYAITAYSYVNKVGQYEISITEWIDNIKRCYNIDEPRTREVIRVLLSL